MKEILAYHKETEKKYRWDGEYQGAPFELYIPRWRVPVPLPKKITVRIYTEPEFRNQIILVSRAKVSKDPSLATNPIAARIVYNREHTKTVRYDPAERNEPEIGSPYIPIALLDHPYPQYLVITVDWN